MLIKKLVSSLMLIILFSVPAFSMNMQAEINYLLDFVSNTECRYERNGVSYTGVAAAKHIRRKYLHFIKDIDSTEKFIELSATKSTASGKYYIIHCNNAEPIKSQDWLLQELAKVRQKQSS